jgi:hypothetical protein
MKYCGGNSVRDICHILEEPLREDLIAYVCRETLKVRPILLSLLSPSS